MQKRWLPFAAILVLLTFVPPPAAALEGDELLALIALPLVVNEVAEMGVPVEPFFDVVSMLNDADVPAPQFVEVVRYVPVALVVEQPDRDFVRFVRLRRDEGLVGTSLVTAIERELRFYGLDNDARFRLSEPRPIVFDDDQLIPAIVRTRIVETREHPHGGPPGQIKKELGLQTGAEVVHGSKPGKNKSRDQVVAAGRTVDDDDRGSKNNDRIAKPNDKGSKAVGTGRGNSAGKGKPGSNKASKGKGKNKP